MILKLSRPYGVVSCGRTVPSDMVIDFVFEKCMGTRRGDKELAVWLAQGRGYLARAIVDKAKGAVDKRVPRILVERE